MKRRDFLKQGVALGMVPSTFSGLHGFVTNASTLPTSRENGCHAFFLDQTLMIYRNNRLMANYQFDSNQKSPGFGLLAGPRSGRSLISTEKQSWAPGRSLFFSCDRINGNHFWQGSHSQGKIITTDVLIRNCAYDSVELVHECQWIDRKSRPIIQDDRFLSIRFLSENIYTIDCSFTITPLVDITIEPTSHTFLGLKTANDIAPDGGGTLRNSCGLEGMKNTFGKAAKWCTCFGKRQGVEDSPIEGIALFVPESPLEETSWFTRDYGFLAPTSLHFLKKPWKRQENDALTLRYRVVAYAGEPNDDLFSVCCGEKN